MRRKRVHIGALALLTAASVLSATSAASGKPPASPRAGGQDDVKRLGTVTLITGDRITLTEAGGKIAPSIERGPGRDKITFLADGSKDRVLVIPSDAVDLLAADKIDERLFDVTGLLETGYGDGKRATLPLLVKGGKAALADTKATATFAAIDATAVRPAKKDVGELWRDLRAGGGANVGKIWLDGVRRVSLSESVPQIGAPVAWKAGYTGKGVKIAVLDQAVDVKHPDIAGRVAEARDFTGRPSDGQFHGTHVASTALGGGVNDPTLKGVAPEASLLAGQVCDQAGLCWESAVLAGMQWAAQSGAKVINMSFGSPDGAGTDLLEEAVDALTEKYGSLFVAAAGNVYGSRTVSSPGTAEAALSVGMVDKSDELSFLSSRGPRAGDSAVKPDITAPGVQIKAAVPGGGYDYSTGTSMAAPHVTGAVALLAQQHPDWTAEHLKAALIASAKPREDLGAFDQGAGRVDLARAIDTTVVASPPSVSFGVMEWPHDDDEPTERKLTYRNGGAEDVTLALDLTGSAPKGMFGLGADKVVVPAGGTASVDVVATATDDDEEGTYSAQVVATAGDEVMVRTPIGLDKERESYDFVFDAKSLDGESPRAGAWLTNTTTFERFRISKSPGEKSTVRLPKGRYFLATLFTDEGVLSYFLEPGITVDGETTRSYNAATADPIKVSYSDPAVRPSQAAMMWSGVVDGLPMTNGVFAPSYDGLRTKLVGDVPGLRSMLTGLYTKTASGVDHRYYSAWFLDGMPGAFTKMLTDADQATAQQRVGTLPADPSEWEWHTSARSSSGGPPRPGQIPPVEFQTAVRTPNHHVAHFTAGAPWAQAMTTPSRDRFVASDPRTYRGGERFTERWNSPVMSPSLTANSIGRRHDRIGVSVPTLGDSSPDHAGYDDSAQVRLALYRGDTLVDEVPFSSWGFDVPAEPTDYRLEMTAKRPGAELSPRTDTVWTFSSQRPDGEQPQPQPVQVVKFAPQVDQYGNARAGAPQLMQVRIDRSGVGVSRSLTLDTSADGGQTWQPATIYWCGMDCYLAWVDNPAAGTAVSVRAKATDSSGSTVEQTVVDAYRTK